MSFFPPSAYDTLLSYASFSSPPSFSCPPRTRAVLESVDVSIEVILCNANETTSSSCYAICYIPTREVPAQTWSSTAIGFNFISNLWLSSISNRTTLTLKMLQQKKSLCKENPCISYSELSLFWNHNPGSALANPDVDGFKIITQHNTAATLIHLPMLILPWS